MKVQSIAEIKDLLKNCRATHVQNVAPTGFYQLKAHAVRFPDGRLETREYLDKSLRRSFYRSPPKVTSSSSSNPSAT